VTELLIPKCRVYLEIFIRRVDEEISRFYGTSDFIAKTHHFILTGACRTPSNFHTPCTRVCIR